MTSNMALWDSVEKTPVEQTKPITGKQYRGNSPKPHFLVKRATEAFGPCGIGWGFNIVEEKIVDGQVYKDGTAERMHYAKVRVWYMQGGQKGEVEHVGGTIFSGKRRNGDGYTDDDAPKKSVTDALVKALSMIGFAGDIFLGRYDDSKYMDELQQEAREAKKAANESNPPANTQSRPKQQRPPAQDQSTPFDDIPPDNVDYVSSDGTTHSMPLTNALAKLWKAYEAPALGNAAFLNIIEANEAWLKARSMVDYEKLCDMSGRRAAA